MFIMRERALGLAAIVLLLACRGAAAGDDYYWVGPTGGFPPDYSWMTPANWDRGSVPGSDDRAHVANGRRAGLGIGYTGGNARVEDLFVGEGGNDGEVRQGIPATVRVDNSLTLGYVSGTGVYKMNGWFLHVDDLHVGQSTGDNTFDHNRGYVYANEVHVGSAGAGSKGYYEMDGSGLRRFGPGPGTDLHIADSGGSNVTGVFTQTDGDVLLEELSMGDNAGTTGKAVYDLQGGTLTIDSYLSPPWWKPFDFNSAGSNVFFNFGRDGTLILEGDWDFSSLTGISRSDFRVFGQPAQPTSLEFTPGTGNLEGLTIITANAIIPEPSTFLIWGLLSLLGLLGWAGRRKRRTKE